MDSKVLGANWYNTLSKTGFIIGIVKVEDYGEIKYYIGLGEGQDEETDINMVLEKGTRFFPAAFKEVKNEF